MEEGDGGMEELRGRWENGGVRREKRGVIREIGEGRS